MTIERAIEILDPEHREHYESIEPINEACRMGMQALKKQIPERVKYASLTEYKFSWVCPNCNTQHVNEWCGTNRKLPYCSQCGQALDWSDTE